MHLNMDKRCRLLVFSIYAFFLLVAPFYLHSDEILVPYYQWEGSRSSDQGGGVSTLGNFSDSGFQFSWSITQTAPSVFHYVYTLTPTDTQKLSNVNKILLGVSESVASGQTLPNTHSIYNLNKASFYGKGPYLRETSYNGTPNYLTSYQYIGSSDGTINPNGSLYGFTITPSSSKGSSISFSFDSAFSPIWGSFFISSSTGVNVAQNTGLTTTGMLPSVSSDYMYYVAVPGSNSRMITPEPATYFILAMSLAIAAYIVRRRSLKPNLPPKS